MRWFSLRLRYGQKLFALATLPLVLAVGAIAWLVAHQARSLSEDEITALETRLLAAKRAELQNYLSIARSAFAPVYNRAGPDDEAAKLIVTQVLSAMTYGRDGYFFVYTYDGTNLVSPRKTDLITRNWSGLTDAEGTPVVDRLIDLARQGGGYHSYIWEKPSTGEPARMMTYVIGLQDWQWVVGTGVFIDDVLASVDAATAKTEARVTGVFFWIGAITLIALLGVFASGMVLNIRERRLADAKLKRLTQRVLDTQEEERGRVARELHDSISQLLVGVRYALELARHRLRVGDRGAIANLDTGLSGLGNAIAEVRRISHDLRPGQLDDLGLGPALKSLCEEFGRRTGLAVSFQTVPFSNRLGDEAKIALYRIAQEALTNIERHAAARRVSVEVFGHRAGATLRIEDDGCGLPDLARRSGGLGLRNMQERMDHLGGSFTIRPGRGGGTRIEASVPLRHMLPPEPRAEDATP